MIPKKDKESGQPKERNIMPQFEFIPNLNIEDSKDSAPIDGKLKKIFSDLEKIHENERRLLLEYPDFNDFTQEQLLKDEHYLNIVLICEIVRLIQSSSEIKETFLWMFDQCEELTEELLKGFGAKYNEKTESFEVVALDMEV